MRIGKTLTTVLTFLALAVPPAARTQTGVDQEAKNAQQARHVLDEMVQALGGQAWLDALGSIREILASDGRTLAQGALAWIWGRSPNTVPIPGFRTVAQVEENAKAMEFGPLTPTQMAEIDRILGR